MATVGHVRYIDPTRRNKPPFHGDFEVERSKA